MEIVLVKQTDALLEEPAATHVRNFLFGHLDGATEQDTKAWRRFIRAMHEAAAGECFSITIKRQRVGWLHRKQMALEGQVFKTSERFTDKEAFRLWLKIGAGFVTWCPGPKGGVFPVPKSSNFNLCSEEEADDYRSKVLEFLRTEHAQHYLWPSLSPMLASKAMEQILDSFEGRNS